MIGGGSPRVLRLAGKEADIVSLNFNNRSGAIGPDGVNLSSAEETKKKIGWIKEGAGDRFGDLEIEIGAYFTFVTYNPAPIVGEFSKIFDRIGSGRGAFCLFSSCECSCWCRER